MTTQAALWTLAGSGAVVAVAAALADRRRTKRRNLDAPGWVPWTMIQLVAMILAAVAAAVALKA